MAEFTGKEDAASCQKKLAPPRTLRDSGRTNQIVWDTIAKRYPKAAPLLCEMETVIDRAETLLHRMKTLPYDNEIGKSNSTQISRSDEFDRKFSASSVVELSSTSEEINEEVEEVEGRVSYDRIPKMEDPSSSTSSASVAGVEEKGFGISRNEDSSIDESTNTENIYGEKSSEKIDCKNRSKSKIHEEKRNTVATKDVESLERWEKVVSGKMMVSKKVNVKKEISIGRHDRSESSSINQTIKSNIPSVKESARIHEEKGFFPMIDSATCSIESATTKKNKKNENALSPKKLGKTKFESSPNRNTKSNAESLSNRIEMQNVKEKPKMASGNENHNEKSPKTRKTSVEILTEYATQIGKKVEFKKSQNKSNSWKLEGSFAGYTGESIGNSESEVRNKVATIILRKLAEKQIDEHDMENFTPFSDQQMRDIVALGVEDTPENAMRKLYKLCLEKNAPKPIYSIDRKYESEGYKLFATCRALGKVGHGVGIRDKTAKISAAEELYTKLRSENY